VYRPSVQAVPGAKVRRTHPTLPILRPAVPMDRYAVRSGQDARNAASRRLRRSRPNAVSARDGRSPRLPDLRLLCHRLLSSR
jgi:hypothetical protein